MSNSKHLPPFIFDLLCYLNRDHLERYSIVSRPLKNFIERYFNSKPYRIFDRLEIRGGSYALIHNDVQWHPNRDDYSVQQFLDGQKCSIYNWSSSWRIAISPSYYSFAEMHPYLCPNIRIKDVAIYVTKDSIYNPEHIAEMESISYLWRDGNIDIKNAWIHPSLEFVPNKRAEYFQPIFNSATILQCRLLAMNNARLSFKDYKVLYSVKVIKINYDYEDFNPNSLLEFLKQPGAKPVVVLRLLHRDDFDNLLDSLSKAFFSAALPNAFKIAFILSEEPLAEFRETNNTSGEILELKKGLPVEYQAWGFERFNYYNTLERSII
ncbi:hypothetical protein Ddc_19678 [Ditylenchus destructor]|nr:hypothetical protein Ddc_19678 [Ditylenchus destructor]